MKSRIFPVMERDLHATATLGPLTLSNRIVMAPMTRNRAAGGTPNELMALYYAQRAGAGLIVTEGTSPSPNGLGYVRIPGIYSRDQVAGWRLVTRAVHDAGGRIVLQLMHNGRLVHRNNLPPGARILAPSRVRAGGTIFAAGEGRVPFPEPEEMTLADIQEAIGEYAAAAVNAHTAGFDAVELHAANGYLLEQFLRPGTNLRTDAYGGDAAGRARFVLEVAHAAARAIGAERVGIRLSPFGTTNDMHDHDTMEADYVELARELGRLGLLYVHLVDHGTFGSPPVPDQVKRAIRKAFPGPLILSGGYDAARAAADLAAGHADLIAVGRAFIANPDLPERWRRGAPLAVPDRSTFYSDGEKGYTDYPPMNDTAG